MILLNKLLIKIYLSEIYIIANINTKDIMWLLKIAVIEIIERATELKYSINRSSRYAIQGRIDIRVIKNGYRINAETIRGDLEFSGVRIYESR
jgi:hypothetical protein